MTFIGYQDRKAPEKLARGELLSRDDNIILDIDEDFFGCEAAVTRFKRVRESVCMCLRAYNFQTCMCGCMHIGRIQFKVLTSLPFKFKCF